MNDEASPHPPVALSRREREVAVLATRDLSDRQIADRLHIAPATVDRHVANILSKRGTTHGLRLPHGSLRTAHSAATRAEPNVKRPGVRQAAPGMPSRYL